MPRRAGEPDALAVALGIPPGLLQKVKGPITFEQFNGWDVSSRSEKQYLFSATSGATSSFGAIDPASGDLVSDGLKQWTLTPDPAAPKGAAVSLKSGYGADSFSAARPTIWAARIRFDGVKPDGSNLNFVSLGGIATWASSTGDVTDGVDIFYDTTIGVDAWVLRASRASSAVLSTEVLAFDNDFHTAGFLHEGDVVTPFVDGVALAARSLADPEIQPDEAVRPIVGRGRTESAAADVLSYTGDWVLHGR